MALYQLIYTSSAQPLSGSPGFGVRTVTEGTPKEIISLVEKTSSLRDYNSGKFSLGNYAEVMSSTPERVFEYPRTYYYRVLTTADGKKYYAVGRSVNTVFDHDFYATGEVTRSGNFAAHIFISGDNLPREIYDLLYESPVEGGFRFLPVDWTPVKDNPELVRLETGAPEMLPAEERPLGSIVREIRPESITLLLAWIDALKEDRQMIVTTRSEDAAAICAGFMRMVPETLLEKATFQLNHQQQGFAGDCALSFVNEYYRYEIYPTMLHCDLTAAAGNNVWRPLFEELAAAGNYEAIRKVAEWLLEWKKGGNTAVDMLGRTAGLVDSCPEFARTLFGMPDIYKQLYSMLVEGLKPESWTSALKAVEEYVLDIVPEDMEGRKDWSILAEVLSASVPENDEVKAYYALALKLDKNDALRSVAPLLISTEFTDEAGQTVALIIERGLMSDSAMLDRAAGLGLDSRTWLAVIGNACKFDKARLDTLREKFGLGYDEDYRLFLKENFPEEYRKMKSAEMIGAVKDFAGKIASKFSLKKKTDDTL